MLLDQRKTRRMAQIVAIIAAVGFVGIIFIVVGVLVFQGDSTPEGDAVKLAMESTRNRPKDPVAWDELANAQANAQNYPEAVKAAQTALNLRPRDANRLGNLVTFMSQANQNPQAFTLLERFTARNPNNAQGFLLLGDMAERLSKKNVALLAYVTFLRLAPDSSLAPAVQQRLLELQQPPASTAPSATTPTTPAAPSHTVPVEPVTP
jgi:predicted Zn-dependent protease